MKMLFTIALLLLMYGVAESRDIIYIPVYSPCVHRTPMSRPYFRSQPYFGGSANQPMPSVTRGRMTPDRMPKAFANPKLIINPFVDQTPYKGLGEQFIR